MKKNLFGVLVLMLLMLGASAANAKGLVAVKSDDGVFLSWNKTDAESYTLYRDGQPVVTTKKTNYVDAAGTAASTYTLDGETVKVWEKGYLEIPVANPSYDPSFDPTSIPSTTIKLSGGGDMPYGEVWCVLDSNDGYKLFMAPAGTVLDVNGQSTEAGAGVGLYGYNSGENQKFVIEEAQGGSYIKGVQSNLYLRAEGEKLVLSEKATATLFSMKNEGAPLTEGQLSGVKLIVGMGFRPDKETMKNYTIKPADGSSMPFGSVWCPYILKDGTGIIIAEDGNVLDAQRGTTDLGGKIGTYAYNAGENQKYVLETADGGSYIKGIQSGFYLKVEKDSFTFQEKANATLFTVEPVDSKLTAGQLRALEAATGHVLYSPNDACIDDLDGDGQYEIVLKWDPSDSKDASQNGPTGRVYIDAYKLDGTQLWRIDMGPNIRAGAHDTQMIVYDLDQDGKAEVALRTADGTVDGEGNVLNDPDAIWTKNGLGKNIEGPLYVTVFNGTTGKAVAQVPFDPNNGNGTSESFGDNYGNRSERYNACVAYLDGEKPYMVLQRGYYARTVVAAYSFDGKEIKKYWRFDTSDPGKEQYGSQGNHNVSVADVDGDGKDEIFFGSLTLDHDGSVLWCSYMSHGDAMHLGDFDPDRPGLEFFTVHEHATEKQKLGFTIFDAKTGEIIHFREAGRDTGRGMIAVPGNFGGTYYAWGAAGAGKINSKGENVDFGFGGMNFRIYWDGDLYDDFLDGTYISGTDRQGNPFKLFDAADYGCGANNSTKNNPCLQADFLGDWREEIICRTQDNTAIRIFTTTIPTEYSIEPLMTDHVYRMGIVWQNSSYNQPPHLGYYLPGVVKLTIDSNKADLNGWNIELDTAPTIINDRTMVPIRFIAEAFDAQVDYDNGIVTIVCGGHEIKMTIGQTAYTVDGTAHEMDTAPVIVNDRTLVPVRAVSEALNKDVKWDGEERSVTVTRKRE